MTDKAERLADLMKEILECGSTIHIEGNQWAAIPFPRGIQAIYTSLGFFTYIDLSDRLIGLCQGIREDIASMSLKKESVRTSWNNCLLDIQGVFNPENFTTTTAKVLNRHFSGHNITLVDTMSEKIQTSGLQESKAEDLKSALSAVEEAISEMASAGDIDDRIITLLKFYVSQLKSIYENYEIFGEGRFWNVYKETSATFLQVHSLIINSKNSTNICQKIGIALSILSSKTISGISLIANAAAITTFYLEHIK